MIDKLDTKLAYCRAREVKQGDAEKHYNKALKYIDANDTLLGLKKHKNKLMKKWLKLN